MHGYNLLIRKRSCPKTSRACLGLQQSLNRASRHQVFPTWRKSLLTIHSAHKKGTKDREVTCGGTGAGQGIGRAFAHALGEAGASVAIVDINLKKAQEVTEELRSKGIRSIAVGTDVTKKADCKK